MLRLNGSSLPIGVRKKVILGAKDALERDWDRMVTFYQFPREHWRHLRTINIVESPFAELRLRTAAAKRFKKVPNATAVIWKMMMLAERRFRKLDAPERMKQVFLGVQFDNGIEVTPSMIVNPARAEKEKELAVI
jgi:putative transposase